MTYQREREIQLSTGRTQEHRVRGMHSSSGSQLFNWQALFYLSSTIGPLSLIHHQI